MMKLSNPWNSNSSSGFRSFSTDVKSGLRQIGFSVIVMGNVGIGMPSCPTAATCSAFFGSFGAFNIGIA